MIFSIISNVICICSICEKTVDKNATQFKLCNQIKSLCVMLIDLLIILLQKMIRQIAFFQNQTDHKMNHNRLDDRTRSLLAKEFSEGKKSSPFCSSTTKIGLIKQL